MKNKTKKIKTLPKIKINY